MAKKTITGKPAHSKTAPPKVAFRFAAAVKFGVKPRAKAKFDGTTPTEEKPAGELSDEPPADQLDGEVTPPATEEKPAELSDEPPAPLPTELNSSPVSIVARTGGVADQLFWGRCVHDFAGMSAPAVIPLDYMHDPEQIVGFASQIDATSGSLNITGVIQSTRPGDRAEDVLLRSKAGTPYQASILMGWNDYLSEDLPAGATAEVNGQQINGPVVIFRQWSLRGVAICPYGADAGTSIGLDGEAPPATEEKPAGELDGEGETPEKPAGELSDDDKPAAEMDGEVYLEEFGDRGGVYFAKGLSLSKARAAFASDLRAENDRLRADLAKAKGQLSAGTNPVSFQSAEPNKGNGANTTNLTPGLARFASGLSFKK